ncbi:MAG: sucrase ferredoxin [Anaerolineae bacterium]
MHMTETPTKLYCNCLALERGLDPVGYAGNFQDAIVIEMPLPWKRDMMQQAGVLPQPITDLLALWLQRYLEGQGYPHLPMVIAPDAEYSQDGYHRVMLYTRPAGLFAQFEKVEYLVPVEAVGTLVWALYEDRAVLPQFEAYRLPESQHIRDILVCTHGTVDAACAKFGYPLYKHMRETYSDETLRVWRVSHFGGHVFAPTLMDMPTGHYWAYVENKQAAQIIQRDGDVNTLRGHYRGWAGLGDSFQQTVEYELWQQHGWAWFDYPKSGETTAQDDNAHDPQWGEVRLRYTTPDQPEAAAVEMRVEVVGKVETPHTTGEESTYAYPQYRAVKTETAL